MRLVDGPDGRVQVAHGCVKQPRAWRVERERDEVEAGIARANAFLVDHACDAAVPHEDVVGREVPMDDRVGGRHAIAEAVNDLLAAPEQLARAIGVVAERREPKVRAGSREDRRSDHPRHDPPVAGPAVACNRCSSSSRAAIGSSSGSHGSSGSPGSSS